MYPWVGLYICFFVLLCFTFFELFVSVVRLSVPLFVSVVRLSVPLFVSVVRLSVPLFVCVVRLSVPLSVCVVVVGTQIRNPGRSIYNYRPI